MTQTKKKICFFVTDLNFSGGAERVSTFIANALLEKNYEVQFLNLYGGDTPHFYINNEIKISSLYMEKRNFSKLYLDVVKRLRFYLKTNKIDILVNVDSLLTLYSILATAFLKIRNICWEHFTYEATLGSRLRKPARQLAAIFCDSIIVLTNRDKKSWQKKTLHIAPIIKIFNPSSFKKSNHTPSISNKIILSIGKPLYIKGYDLLIKAWAKAIKSLPDWKLFIVGIGKEEDSLKKMIFENQLESSIEIIRITKDVEQYYKKASFFVLSSRYEGFSLVLAEAFSFNIPAVSFNCPNGPYEIINNNKTGILVAPEDIEALSKSIVSVGTDEALYNFFVDNLKSEKNRFSIEAIMDEWIKLLNK